MTIAAVATGAGGALAVVRVSGPGAMEACDAILRGGGRYAHVVEEGEVVDDVVVQRWYAPRSYTGEDVVEISCHGSRYIQDAILRLLISRGVRIAAPGEFTMRALMNGKLDLSQAEAVADLISAEDRASHALAMNQMRGGYSAELEGLRMELVELAALLELELDFGEEDVEFADRGRLSRIVDNLIGRAGRLAGSFATGNALKNGVAVAIAGSPNVGKSTLLNALLGDDRAMVSDIAGTTRDTVEERAVIGGIGFRFIDTAGLRATDDPLESMGIERTRAAVERAGVVLLVVDRPEDIAAARASVSVSDGQRLCVLVNKCDLWGGGVLPEGAMAIGAREGEGLDALCEWLTAGTDYRQEGNIVTNARHYEALTHALGALERVREGISNATPPDFLSMDLRDALHHIGLITGAVTPDDLLHTIFSRFCIGK